LAALSAIAVGLLAVGLVVGAGLTYVAVPPRSVTSTQTSSITGATTQLSTITVTSTQTQIQPITQTQIQPITQTQTETVTRSVTATATVTSTVTQLSTLVSFSGSGNNISPPFTATTVGVHVNYSITATTGCAEGVQSCPDVSFAWYIFQEGSSAYTCSGSRPGTQGYFTDYCYGLTVGVNYEVQILAANCIWQTSVIKSD
jgi:hypothetical protein